MFTPIYKWLIDLRAVFNDPHYVHIAFIGPLLPVFV